MTRPPRAGQRPQRLTPEQAEWALARRMVDGWSLDRIAARLDVTTHILALYLPKRLPMGCTKGPNSLRAAQSRRAAKQNRSAAE